jgi:hypothetical protein
LKYSCQKRSPVPITPSDPLDEQFLKKSIKELIAIMSSKWVEEVELSYEEVRIHTPSSTIRCSIGRTSVDVFYNPIVGANLMSVSFAHTYFSDDAITSTIKTYRIAPHIRLEGLGALHNISLYHNDNEVPLDFHVFDI